MGNYYVYVYLDPRKPGDYNYKNINFKFEPIYIGKGKKDRAYYHLETIINNHKGREKKLNPHLKNKIKKIIDDGLSPIIIKYYNNLDEDKAFLLEKYLIDDIGRILNNSGPLTNFSEGGEGSIGIKWSKESRQKMRNIMIGITRDHYTTRSDKGVKREPLSKEHRNKLSESHKGKILSKEHKDNISKGSKGTNKTWTKESYKKSLESKRKKWPSKEKVLEYIEKYKTKNRESEKLGISHPTLGTICEFYHIKIDWKKNLGSNQYTKKL